MPALPAPPVRLGDGITRRDWLRAGALGAVGLSLPELSRRQQVHAASPRPRADSCILVFLQGGPSQLDTFDPKPDAPVEVRGEFGVTKTTTPGVVFSDRLPLLAQRLQQFALIRTCATSSGRDHHGGIYEALTGFVHPNKENLAPPAATSSDHPCLGAVVAKWAPGPSDGVRAVQFPDLVRDVGPIPGQSAGLLGPRYTPFLVQGNPADPNYGVQALNLPREVAPTRLDDRQRLLGWVDQQQKWLEELASVKGLTTYQQQALQVLGKAAFKQAFDLSREPAAVRDRYGRNLTGQSYLLARRLVEANVKFVMVNAVRQSWDTHDKSFPALERLLPPFDLGLSTLLEDLSQRGLAERTLVIVVGEFGRTPQINKNAGRDHWGSCYSALVAGGGVRGGQVIGQSDRFAAYPGNGRVVTPGDVCTTVYESLGINPDMEFPDAVGRPLSLATGRPLNELF